MVHIVEKKIGNHLYLYLQKSIYTKGKRKTEHVAYLGRKENYRQGQLDNLINVGNKDSILHLNSLLKKYNKQREKKLIKKKA